MSFNVINPGMLTLIEDSGRQGFQHLGITTGGPMDEHAFYWANRLLGNSPDASQLEITFGQLQLVANAAISVAITGADLAARLNDKPIQPWCTYALKKGDTLAFGAPVNGLRAYLAVVGGFQVEEKLGSASTVKREQLGGLSGNGDPLKKGDVLHFTPHAEPIVQRAPKWTIPDYNAPLELGVMPAYQNASFSHDEQMTFFTNNYEVSQNIDRMGYRLSGTPIKSRLDGIISEGIAFGAIQIPNDGQPIVLMKDRQTIGGYPKIGCLSSLGAGQLSQRQPGQIVTFTSMDVADAEVERRLFNRVIFG
ncbi:biotin-dependent carboxyltransferase family protein [Enterovibrio norvegicus]|uniref:5-oxoprolinase subunit C family protein n=1 Tax=Enterovibrio norvegicus TaxID=188144 RepID=UPI000C83E5C9|nr:biotin-dependent carboxyltransferase family protein [Enterovibrio norvegicus]PML81891.1 allophanate hydrolase [Enterovibrio norvegicus]